MKVIELYIGYVLQGQSTSDSVLIAQQVSFMVSIVVVVDKMFRKS